ncbi:MAG TPA: dihydroorotate dehydrogenase [Gemmatimonadaceae bacterium]|nr:dihydroorotate dehydrogenase [Gemmatimonadaceae bacterium]
MSAAAPTPFAGPLAATAAGLTFQNPVLLAAGTAAYGRELADVVALDALGGLVTKAVSLEPRAGASAPRVADFGDGMINAVGLANPGVAEVKAHHLPWLAATLTRARVLVNVVGRVVEEFGDVVAALEDAPGVHAFELNVSCPNTRAGGLEFGADPASLDAVVRRARAATRRALFVKLSPTLPDVGDAARRAVDAGADGITVVNTMPGLVIDVATRRPVLGYGTGGVSGPGLRPVGVLATWRVRQAVRAPIIGAGGVATAEDALQYLLAGATLVAIGTAALANPRAPERLVRDLARWCAKHRIAHLADLVGTLEWPA